MCPPARPPARPAASAPACTGNARLARLHKWTARGENEQQEQQRSTSAARSTRSNARAAAMTETDWALQRGIMVDAIVNGSAIVSYRSDVTDRQRTCDIVHLRVCLVPRKTRPFSPTPTARAIRGRSQDGPSESSASAGKQSQQSALDLRHLNPDWRHRLFLTLDSPLQYHRKPHLVHRPRHSQGVERALPCEPHQLPPTPPALAPSPPTALVAHTGGNRNRPTQSTRLDPAAGAHCRPLSPSSPPIPRPPFQLTSRILSIL